MDRSQSNTNFEKRKASKDKLVLAYVSLPPPMNGQARNSLRMVNYLSTLQNVKVQTISYPSKSSSRSKSLQYYFQRLKSVYKVIKLLKKIDYLYMCAESGWGLYLLIIIGFFVKKNKTKLILHFRTREFLHKKNIMFNLVPWSYKNLTCIVLCDSYKEKLETRFKPNHIIKVSNLSMYSFKQYPTEINYKDERFITFFSNMIWSKGINDFIELAKTCSNHKFLLAGNCNDIKVKTEIERKIKPLKNILFKPEYNTLREVLPNTMMLVFPSRYPIEVEPNVIYEFYMEGIPIISTNIGCVDDLKEILDIDIIDVNDDFLIKARHIINSHSFERYDSHSKIKKLEDISKYDRNKLGLLFLK